MLAASSGLFVAFSLAGSGEALAAAKLPPTADGTPPDAAKLSAWLAVHPDNTATLFTGKVEVGTGTQTALAQIAAEELDFPIDRMNVVMGTTSKTVFQGPTYGSMTIRHAGPQLRNAAAAGRQELLKLAAAHFRVKPDQLVTKDGMVSVKGASARTISYGKLVDGKRLDVAIGATGRGFGMKVAPGVKTRTPQPTRWSASRSAGRTSRARSPAPTPTSRT
ncbi:MAG TPA: molybdopterin cofactor-binding domain-containing protein [Acidiphilium sp.]